MKLIKAAVVMAVVTWLVLPPRRRTLRMLVSLVRDGVRLAREPQRYPEPGWHKGCTWCWRTTWHREEEH